MDPATRLALVIALVPAGISAAVAAWAVAVGVRQRRRERMVEEALRDVEATAAAYQAEHDYLIELAHGNTDAAARAVEHSGQLRERERLRYYGSKDLVLRWWNVRDELTDAIEAGASASELSGLIDDLLDVQRAARAAFATARERLIAARWSDPGFSGDAEIQERQAEWRRRNREKFEQWHKARVWTAE